MDDQLYFGSRRAFEEKFEQDILKRFNLNLLGEVHWYLQARIQQDKKGNISLDQSRYCTHIIERYLKGQQYDNNKHRDTPLPQNIKMSKT